MCKYPLCLSYSRSLFGYNVGQFIEKRIRKCIKNLKNHSETFHKDLLQFCVKVIELDFTHWWRNSKSSKFPPLIREVTDVDNIDAFILSLELCLKKKDFALENIMLKLLSMISVFVSFNENRKCNSLRNKNSRRYELKNKLCYILKDKASLKEMVFYASLIRPSWLSRHAYLKIFGEKFVILLISKQGSKINIF